MPIIGQRRFSIFLAVALFTSICASPIIMIIQATTMEAPPYVDYDYGYNSTKIINLQVLNSSAPYIAEPFAIGNVLYAGTYYATLVKSLDYGVTWTLVFDFAAQFGEETPLTAYVAIWYSSYWHYMFASFGSNSAHPYLYRSTNLGLSWSNVMTFAHQGYLYNQDGIDEDATSGTIYVGQYGSSTGGWGTADNAYINKSTNGGMSWSVETTIICEHIHSVTVAYDRSIFAGYGDAASAPNTAGCVKKPFGGAWANVTWLPLMWAQPTGGITVSDATLFATDGGEGSSVPTYKDGDYFGDLLFPGITSSPTWYCRSLTEVNGVIYAALEMNYHAVNPDGSALFASPDYGDNWYMINFTINPSDWNWYVGGVDDGPYILWVNKTGRTILGIDNIRAEGYQELLFGGKSASTVSSTVSIRAYMANSNWTAPMFRNAIRNPSVTIQAINGTSLAPNGRIETAWPTDFDRVPSSGDYSWNTTQYTEGTHSVKVNMSDTDTSSAYIKCKFYPISGTSANTIVGMFDAKRDSGSSYFYCRAYLSITSDRIPLSGRYLSLTTEWRTYAVVLDGTAKTSWTGGGLSILGENPVNMTAYFDNFRIFKLPSTANIRENAFIIENKPFYYNTAKKTANVSVIIDGSTHSYGATSYNNGTTIDTIDLTGDYYDNISIRASCDGILKITISGQRLSYGSNMLGISNSYGYTLLGGNDTAFYRFIDVTSICTNATNKIDVNNNSLFRWTDEPVDITVTGINATLASGLIYINCTVWIPNEDTTGITIANWTATTSDPALEVLYIVSGVRPNMGYKAYQDGILVGSSDGGGFNFSAIGNGTFMLITWYSSSVSALIGLAIDMVALGIFISVVAPTVKALKNPRIPPQQKVGTVIRMVIFIIIGLVMWGLLYSVAYG